MTMQEPQPESAEALKAQVRQIVECAFNEGQVVDLAQIYAPTLVHHEPPHPDIVGLDAYRQEILGMRAAFPDLIFHLDEIIIEGSTWAGRFHLQGTNTGRLPYLNMPPTGKPMTMTGLFLLHRRDGLIVKSWVLSDNLGMLRQLGVISPPPPPPNG
jgi:predicted ester cyclase